MKGDLLALRQRLQLLDRGGAAQVERDHHRLVPLAPGEQRQLDRGGRLAGSLEAREHEDCWRGWGIAQPLGVASEQLDQLEVDGPDDLLRRGQARRPLDADKSRPHTAYELLDDLEVDV